MDLSELTVGRTRETRIRRDALGRWWNGEDRIDHPKVVRAFDGWIARADDGRLCLSNDINWAYVQVEGPPYTVRSLRWVEGPDVAELTLSGDRRDRLDPTTLRVGPDEALYCDVFGGTLAARFENAAAMTLGERIDDEGVLRLGEASYPLPTVDDPLATAGGPGAKAVEPPP